MYVHLIVDLDEVVYPDPSLQVSWLLLMTPRIVPA